MVELQKSSGAGDHHLLPEHVAQVAGDRSHDGDRPEEDRGDQPDLRLAEVQIGLDLRGHDAEDGAVALMEEKGQAQHAEQHPFVAGTWLLWFRHGRGPSSVGDDGLDFLFEV